MRVLAIAALCLLTVASPTAQPDEVFTHVSADSLKAQFGTGGGLSIQLNESGFGLGGLYRIQVGATTSVVSEVSFGVAKDAREQQFFIGLFGDTITPFKRNYMLIAPLQIGVEQRVFSSQIEDNFRPYVHAGAGPTIGYQWPYFKDANENGVREQSEDLNGFFGGLGDGQLRLGAGGTLALGAYFGGSRRSAQGVRVGYVASYFFREVDLLELDPSVESPSRHFFGSPTVSFHIVRLLN